MSLADTSSWICCQIGAREHYSIPRALLGRGTAVTLLTDVWSKPGIGSLLQPKQWRQRYHDDLKCAAVFAWNRRAAFKEVDAWARRYCSWTRICDRNEWFQDQVSRVLPTLISRAPVPPTVFAYSYAARKILETANRLGCRTILGQIDPGPVEMRLVEEVHRRWRLPAPDSPPPEYWTQWRSECELADIVLVNSAWSKQALAQEGVSGAHVKVVELAYEKPAAAIPKKPRPTFTHETPLEVLFLGQVIARKGVYELAEAIEATVDRPVRWTIVGGGDTRIHSRLATATNARVIGQVPRDQAGAFYRRADVFILPTHSDGYALTQLEAAAHGLPIIASRFCGEVVRDGVDGLLLAEVSAEAICDAIDKLLDTPGLLARLMASQDLRKFRTIQDLGVDLATLLV